MLPALRHDPIAINPPNNRQDRRNHQIDEQGGFRRNTDIIRKVEKYDGDNAVNDLRSDDERRQSTPENHRMPLIKTGDKEYQKPQNNKRNKSGEMDLKQP